MPTEHSENKQPASQATSVPESDRTPLKDYHPVHDPDKPLAALRSKAVRDTAWVEVCKRIRDAAMMFSRG